jgi:hypothetical protein
MNLSQRFRNPFNRVLTLFFILAFLAVNATVLKASEGARTV